MFLPRLFLLSILMVTPLYLLGGCGGGSTLSGPDPNTQAGYGTVIVKVSGDSGGTVVFLDNRALPLRSSKVTFYNVTAGEHVVTATAPQSFSSSRTVTVIADHTLSVSLAAPTGLITPIPFSTPFGN